MSYVHAIIYLYMRCSVTVPTTAPNTVSRTDRFGCRFGYRFGYPEREPRAGTHSGHPNRVPGTRSRKPSANTRNGHPQRVSGTWSGNRNRSNRSGSPEWAPRESIRSWYPRRGNPSAYRIPEAVTRSGYPKRVPEASTSLSGRTAATTRASVAATRGLHRASAGGLPYPSAPGPCRIASKSQMQRS